MRKKLLTYLLFCFFIAILGFSGGCSSGEITFPQGPISGGGLGFSPVSIQLQNSPSFSLETNVNLEGLYEFMWNEPTGLACANYQVLITETPQPPTFGSINVAILYIVGHTDSLSLTGDQNLKQFINDFYLDNESLSLTAVVICSHATSPLSPPFPRSTFELLSETL